MRNANTESSESHTAQPIVVLVSAGPILRRSLEAQLAPYADVVAVKYRTTAYEAACDLDAQIVVIDLTNVQTASAAHTAAHTFAAARSHLVFLGYGQDEADGRSLAEELNVTFNPGLEGLLELLETPRPARVQSTNGPFLEVPHSFTTQTGSPAVCGVARDALPRGGGVDPMDLMRQLHVRLSNLSLENEEGQTLVEYGLILALIAVVCITILTTLGTNIQGKLTTVSNAL